MAERVENVVELKEDNFGCDKWRKLSKRAGVMSTSSLRFPTLHHSYKSCREVESDDKDKLKMTLRFPSERKLAHSPSVPPLSTILGKVVARQEMLKRIC